MAAASKIEWTDATWSPIRARVWQIQNDGSGKERIGWHCEHVSEGCRNCYAESINVRLGTGFEFKPGNLRGKPGFHGGGIDRPEVFLDEKMLLAPLRWKKPRRIFVNSMSDTFADFVKDEWIDRIFAVMALCPQHTFQVLTKRAGRMREYMTIPVQGGWAGRVTRVDDDGTSHPEWDAPWRVRGGVLCDLLPKAPAAALNSATAHLDKLYGEDGYDGFMPRWPLPNVWLGVSAERQQEADERIPDLLQTPAAVRFVSLEPLLGAIDLTMIPTGQRVGEHDICANALRVPDMQSGERLDWVIAGGESGPHARPMRWEWASWLRDQCSAADVPFFFKQWGEFHPTPGGFERRGKKAAGRLLDGVEHNGMPA